MRVLDPLGLESQMAISVLGIKPVSSGRATRVHNCCAASPATSCPMPHFNSMDYKDKGRGRICWTKAEAGSKPRSPSHSMVLVTQ